MGCVNSKQASATESVRYVTTALKAVQPEVAHVRIMAV